MVLVNSLHAPSPLNPNTYLSIVMEPDLIPEALVFLQVKVVHARLPNFLVCRTTLDNLSLVAVIKRQIKVSETGSSIKAGSHIGEEGEKRCNVDCIFDL